MTGYQEEQAFRDWVFSDHAKCCENKQPPIKRLRDEIEHDENSTFPEMASPLTVLESILLATRARGKF